MTAWADVGASARRADAAGIEHGVGEILQGSVPPDGVFVMSWPDAAALEGLSGEPAMTVIPNLRVTGTSAFTGFGLALATARAHDRIQATVDERDRT